MYEPMSPAQDIWAVPATGGAPSELTNNHGTENRDFGPAYSPDGTKIAFARLIATMTGTSSRIEVMSAFGAGPTPVITEPPGTVVSSVDWQCTSCALKPAVAAVVSGANQTNRRWRVAPVRKLVQVSRRRPPVGTTFRFTLNKSAPIRFDFTQSTRGRKVSGKCVAQNNRNKRRHRCRRTVIRGTLAFTGHAGVNKVRFFGWLPGRKLRPGTYTLVMTATTPGVGSTSQRLTFTIAR